MQLAERLGVTVQSVNRIENGKQWPPSDLLSSIALAFKVPVHELFVSEGLEYKGQTLESALRVTCDRLGFEIRKKA